LIFFKEDDMKQRFVLLPVTLLLLMAGALTGCQASKTAKGGGIGAAAGAVIGGVIGKATGDTAKGAIIGAAVGGTAGAIIGRQMDQQAAELEADLENAEVERVGEGIQITFNSAILFDVNSANLRTASQADLADLAVSLQKYPDFDITVIGHTDDTGSEEYNQTLSERRATSAAEYLKSQGVAADRITTLGKGELEPKVENTSDTNRQQNRRVEVAIFASEEYRQKLEQEQGNN
jgi:outer membrane protein OmpA-like peptidoglycan-associated protein